MSIEEPMRKTQQEIMPAFTEAINKPTGYDIYPYYPLGDQKIFNGYAALSDYIAEQKTVVIDGYVGVYWNLFISSLTQELGSRGLSLNIIDTASFFKNEAVIDEMAGEFLGEKDAVWGRKTTLTLADFFDLEAMKSSAASHEFDINIMVGCGASLSDWDAALVYVDLPKNELQHRMSAGAICNLGKSQPQEPTEMYKRFYFVDWVVLNNHKESLVQRADVFVDAQWDEEINWAHADTIRDGLNKMSTSVFRARPWFAAGAWGGQWMKRHMPQLDQNEVNYAWSFELIVPENGIVFESEGLLLEVSFDLLMFLQGKNILGKHAERFGTEFPIRFDFLDTFEGGNLSIQCHPSLNYIKEQFGEQITQDETYYILDCNDDASVYLGFQEDINADEFKNVLQNSNENGVEVDIEKYVQVHKAKKHDLFLIPNRTIHSAGAQNLVLEISATPYIFTFKMYDWLRLDLNGKPRPINIDHAFKNLDFSRKGDKVTEQLISKPYLLDEADGVVCYHLPTHADHFYDIHRLEFDSEVEVQTEGLCHVLMLVEGTSIAVTTDNSATMSFAFAETFVIPAAAKSYKIINNGKARAKVIKAFLK
ncbi:class I mannose-6-phosphate isomerase [Pedobacter endophyticus]|uniref:Class I mannose-6-phosphate isomerase n=2 Tax=Pedobacter endophyticus TaxID=2789740 RepID=A0A7S9Q1H9_9SPHI|nr:class I mannose-6-phosphate isomerase [Pedobacter endophyticus]